MFVLHEAGNRAHAAIRCSPLTRRVPRHSRVLRLLLGVWWLRFLCVSRGAVEVEVGGLAHAPRFAVIPPRRIAFGCIGSEDYELAADADLRLPPERGVYRRMGC